LNGLQQLSNSIKGGRCMEWKDVLAEITNAAPMIGSLHFFRW
jgi:hypothetical protein